MKNCLTKALCDKFKNDISSHYFLTHIMSENNVYLFGGAIRDFLDGSLDASRDIDFVIESNTGDFVNILKYVEHLDNVTYRKNRYDGYKITFDNCLTVDIWNLKDTWAFRNKRLEPTAENLIKSVYLNVDALVYSLNKSVFLDNCNLKYRKTIENNFIDIVFDETPYEELNLLRALVFQKKYSLNLSLKIKNRLINYIKNDLNFCIKQFINLQMEHYNQVLIEKDEIDIIFSNLEKNYKQTECW